MTHARTLSAGRQGMESDLDYIDESLYRVSKFQPNGIIGTWADWGLFAPHAFAKR